MEYLCFDVALGGDEGGESEAEFALIDGFEGELHKFDVTGERLMTLTFFLSSSLRYLMMISNRKV